MNYVYIPQPIPSPALTEKEQSTVFAIVIFIVVFFGILAIAGVVASLDIPTRRMKRHESEQKIIAAIADNSRSHSEEFFQPGLTIAEIVATTSLPLDDVAKIVRRFKRDEIVREGKNENGVKTYFV